MNWVNKIKGYISTFIRPSFYMSGMDYFLRLWHEANAKERGILVLVFSPMFLCLAGLFVSVVYFVLFVLPSFVFRVLGWGALTALSGAGGRYCYKYFTSHEARQKMTTTETPEVIEVQYEEIREEPQNTKKRRKGNA